MPSRPAEYWEEKATQATADAAKITDLLSRKAIIEIAELYRFVAAQRRRLDDEAPKKPS